MISSTTTTTASVTATIPTTTNRGQEDIYDEDFDKDEQDFFGTNATQSSIDYNYLGNETSPGIESDYKMTANAGCFS